MAEVVSYKKVTITEYIISSLRYLHAQCGSDDIKAIIQVASQLCQSSLASEPIDFRAMEMWPPSNQKNNFISSMEFLKEEATRHNLDDVEMVLDATFRLCFMIYYLQLRKEYGPQGSTEAN